MSSSPPLPERASSPPIPEAPTSPHISEASTSPPIPEDATSPPIPEAPTSQYTSEASTSPRIPEPATSPIRESSASPSPTAGPSAVLDISTPPGLSAAIHRSTSRPPSPISTSTALDVSTAPDLSTAAHASASPAPSPPSSPSLSTISSGSFSTISSSTSSSPPIPAPLHNYILSITLCPTIIKSPPITRVLSLPASTPFTTLHTALQLSFGWATLHPYLFTIGPSSPFSPTIQLLPPPFYNRKYYGTLELGSHYASDVQLFQFLESPDFEPGPIQYLYDPHSRWEHTVTFCSIAPLTDYVHCLGGEGHPAPEDGHGPVVWEFLKMAYRKRDVARWGGQGPTAEEEKWIRWYERVCETGDEEGLGGGRVWCWDRGYVNRLLGILEVGVGMAGLEEEVGGGGLGGEVDGEGLGGEVGGEGLGGEVGGEGSGGEVGMVELRAGGEVLVGESGVGFKGSSGRGR